MDRIEGKMESDTSIGAPLMAMAGSRIFLVIGDCAGFLSIAPCSSMDSARVVLQKWIDEDEDLQADLKRAGIVSLTAQDYLEGALNDPDMDEYYRIEELIVDYEESLR